MTTSKMTALCRKRKLYKLVLVSTVVVYLVIAWTTKHADIQEEIYNVQKQQEDSEIEELLMDQNSMRNFKLLNDNDGHIFTFSPMESKENEKKEKEEEAVVDKDEKQKEGKQEEDACQPKDRVLFLKTHKTGSSTITSILQVYGFLRNLTFAVPKEGAQIISMGLFRQYQVHPGRYDMLVNHARYNRQAMNKVMKPGAKYITILRDPSTQIESSFAYYRVADMFQLTNISDPFVAFVENPSYYWEQYRHFIFRNYMKNPNLYDLGLSETNQENLEKVSKFIARISREFDLVLIQEYFNESLLLLKKLLCWEMEDILYIPKGMRSANVRIKRDQSFKDSVRKWSWADVLLYDYFNKTLWKKIQEYGPSFKSDLAELESKLKKTLHQCTLPNVRKTWREKYFQKNPKGGPKCTHLLRMDVEFTKLIRNVQYGQTSDNDIPKL